MNPNLLQFGIPFVQREKKLFNHKTLKTYSDGDRLIETEHPCYPLVLVDTNGIIKGAFTYSKAKRRLMLDNITYGI